MINKLIIIGEFKLIKNFKKHELFRKTSNYRYESRSIFKIYIILFEPSKVRESSKNIFSNAKILK